MVYTINNIIILLLGISSPLIADSNFWFLIWWMSCQKIKQFWWRVGWVSASDTLRFTIASGTHSKVHISVPDLADMSPLWWTRASDATAANQKKYRAVRWTKFFQALASGFARWWVGLSSISYYHECVLASSGFSSHIFPTTRFWCTRFPVLVRNTLTGRRWRTVCRPCWHHWSRTFWGRCGIFDHSYSG